ncbi:hypothetical protein [Streptomyces noursei]|uniref:hypothetical protein n=1 Tax=Streptomyces noursei TaxID=1971 RepID=UPI001677D5B6|nr:hypothetical protein [Streptomyces noursei]MCZ1012747.1 hypothetical protein [Streptomyces noursei]GGX42347.1 hypothetical protein GCM10010341_75340 [Streptomyces noursei]
MVVDSAQLRNAVGELFHAIQASGKAADDAKFMLGVLEAKVRGREYYLAACSSERIDISSYLKGITYRKGQWEVAKAQVPSVEGQKPDDWSGAHWVGQWKTIKGERVDIPLTPGGAIVPELAMPCAAMRLLAELSSRLSQPGAWGAVEHVRMSEQYYVGKDARSSGKWQGKGNTCSWTAHSCAGCNVRIPYLICDVGSNWIENP